MPTLAGLQSLIIFKFPHHFYIYWNYTVKKVQPLLICLYITLFISVWTHGYLFYLMVYNSFFLHFISTCPKFGHRAHVQISFYTLLTCSYHVLRVSLLPGPTRCSSFIKYFFSVSPRFNHSSKKSWFLLLEKSIYKAPAA